MLRAEWYIQIINENHCLNMVFLEWEEIAEVWTRPNWRKKYEKSDPANKKGWYFYIDTKDHGVPNAI